MQFKLGASAAAALNSAAHILAVGGVIGGVMLSDASALARVAGSSEPRTISETSAIGQAETLLSEGKFIAARERLLGVVSTPTSSVEQRDDRDRAVELLERVERRIKQTDVSEISLQKAELAVETGDLRQAEKHAQAVLRQPKVSAENATRAKAAIDAVAARRAELTPLVAGLVQQAETQFNAGRYAEAKANLATVYRSGIELTSDQRRVVDTYQVKIVDLERAQGRSFSADTANLALMQPGTVRRDEPLPPPPPAAPAPTPPATFEPGQPVPPPAAQPEMYQPGMSQPTPGSQPAGVPPVNDPLWQPQGNPPGMMTPDGQQHQMTLSASSAPADPMVASAMRAEAQAKIAEGDLALREKRYADAVRLYEAALAQGRAYLQPGEVSGAEASLAQARAAMGGPAITAEGLAGQVLTTERVARERAQAEFDNNLSQADAALKAGETLRALDLITAAKATADRNKEFFSQSENDALARKVAEMRTRAEAANEARLAAEAAKREADLKQAAAQREKTLKMEREKRIVDAINRVRALQMEQKYEEALQVLDQVLFLDPGQPTAMLLRDAISDVITYRRYWDQQKRKAKGIIVHELDNNEATIPPLHIMDYPTDWPTKTSERIEGVGYAETPENARALAALENKKMPVQFARNRLADVLEYVRTNTNTSMDVNWDSLAAIGITKETPVNLQLKDTSADVILKRVLGQVSKDEFSKADYAVSDGIVTVASADDLQRQTVTALYPIEDLLLVVPDYDQVPPLDLATVLSQANRRDAQPFAPKLDTEAERLGGTRAERIRAIINILEQTVDASSWRDNGGDVGSISEIKGALVVNTTPRNHREISGLLSKLRDIRSMQINFETRFLLVNQAWFEQIGFSLDVVFNATNNQIGAAQAVDPTILPSDFFTIGPSNDPRVTLNRNITGGQTTAGATPPSTDVTGQGVVPPNRWSPIGAFQNSLGLGSALAPASGFARDILAAAPALGIAGRFLDDIQVDFIVKATQADRRNLSLTAPRLTLTNGQTANVYVTTQRSFISDLQPVVGDSAVGFDPTTGVVAEGVTLLVEGVVSADRRYVTVNIETGVARTDRIRQVAIVAQAGGQLVLSSQVSQFIELPEQTVTNVQTTVTVPDEGTVLLGGQRLVDELEIETGVPILSKIPIINRFFTNRIESKTESTLLILLKPTILIQSEQEEKNFPGLEDRVRSGAR